MHTFLAEGATVGWLNPVISGQYMMGEVGQAHSDIIEKGGSAGKLVLKVL